MKIVPSLRKDEGAMEFVLNGKHYQDVNYPSFTFQPKVGDIIFFTFSLHYTTIPFTTESDRIAVSFDLMSEGSSHLMARLNHGKTAETRNLDGIPKPR